MLPSLIGPLIAPLVWTLLAARFARLILPGISTTFATRLGTLLTTLIGTLFAAELRTLIASAAVRAAILATAVVAELARLSGGLSLLIRRVLLVLVGTAILAPVGAVITIAAIVALTARGWLG